MTTNIPVSKETIPVYKDLEKTVLIADKHCIIYLKSKLNLECLTQHLIDYHKLFYYGQEDDSPIDKWIFAEEQWKNMGLEPSETETENEEIENASQNEEEDPTPVLQLPSISTKGRNSDSSSVALLATLPPAKAEKRVTIREHLTGLILKLKLWQTKLQLINKEMILK